MADYSEETSSNPPKAYSSYKHTLCFDSVWFMICLIFVLLEENQDDPLIQYVVYFEIVFLFFSKMFA